MFLDPSQLSVFSSFHIDKNISKYIQGLVIEKRRSHVTLAQKLAINSIAKADILRRASQSD